MRDSTITNRLRSAKQFPMIFCEDLKIKKIRSLPTDWHIISNLYDILELYAFVCYYVYILYLQKSYQKTALVKCQLS